MSDHSTTDRRTADADRRSSGADRRSDGRAGRQFIAAFWVADAMLLVLIIFFAIVGGAAESTVLAVVAIACAVLLAIHSVLRHRRRHELSLSPDAREARERRGF